MIEKKKSRVYYVFIDGSNNLYRKYVKRTWRCLALNFMKIKDSYKTNENIIINTINEYQLLVKIK